MISEKEKSLCMAYSSLSSLFSNTYGKDMSEEIFVLLNNPKKLIIELDRIGNLYGYKECTSSFEEEGHWFWKNAVEKTKNYLKGISHGSNG